MKKRLFAAMMTPIMWAILLFYCFVIIIMLGLAAAAYPIMAITGHVDDIWKKGKNQ